MKFKFTDVNTGKVREKEFEGMKQAKMHAREFEDYFDTQVEVTQIEETPRSDGGTTAIPQTVEEPLDWLPDTFVDNVRGTNAINRKGYAVLAQHNNISVVAEPIVRAAESDFTTAEFRAIATTKDGCEYSGFGTAHIDRDTRGGGDDPYLLNELAETRAIKRALSYATGVGMVSSEELS